MALCGKIGADGLPTRDAISQQILLQKLEAAGRRYMRDLRRQATIDVKHHDHRRRRSPSPWASRLASAANSA